MIDFKEPLLLSSGLYLKNRLIMAPMINVSSTENGEISHADIQYYEERAEGLAAVITGAAYVTENGKGWRGQFKVSDNESIPQLAEIAKAIQSKGAKAILQIFHAGRLAKSQIIGEQPVSASFVKLSADAEQPRELKEKEIQEIIEAFGQATRRAIRAGFDGVEIHGANMALVQQFFSRHSNIRNDYWGGSLENRMHFPLAVIDRVLEEVNFAQCSEFAVGYRLSPVEYVMPGIGLDESLEFLRYLEKRRLDYIHLSLGDYAELSNSKAFRDKTLVAYIYDALIGTGIPLIAGGAVRSRNDIERVLEKADLCFIGQQLLIDPAFVSKLNENRDSEFIRKDFSEAIHDLKLSPQLYQYLKNRYQ
ncbi:MAG: NADH-dependent flavin oxidoreductase [Lactovum sp.]